MDLRQIARRCVPCGLVLLAVGCTDPMLGLERPSAEPTLDLATQPSARRQGRAAQPARTRTASPQKPAQAVDTFKLYLVRDASSVTSGPYAKVVVLRRAEPAKVIGLMDWLTEPSGQAGSGDRQFLVYADSAVLDWAADVAAMIDVRAAAAPVATMPQGTDRLMQAVGALYASPAPTEIGRKAGASLAESLESYGTEPGDPHRRWAACMLAGRLLEEVVGQRRGAVVCYDHAAQLAQQGSVAWLVARYRQANALHGSGSRSEARAIAQDIVKQAGQSYSRVRPYLQAEKIAKAAR
jgi:hypothetical protein